MNQSRHVDFVLGSSAISAMLIPCQVTLIRVSTYRQNNKQSYVTGSVNVTTASRGPVLVNEPTKDKSNPSSDMLLLMSHMSTTTDKEHHHQRYVGLREGEHRLIHKNLSNRSSDGADQIQCSVVSLQRTVSDVEGVTKEQALRLQGPTFD